MLAVGFSRRFQFRRPTDIGLMVRAVAGDRHIVGRSTEQKNQYNFLRNTINICE